MVKYLILLLISGTAFAGSPIEGYIEGQHIHNGNQPSYLDGTGPNQTYGLDLELRIPLFNFFSKPVKLMGGVESYGANQGFSQAAGRAGLYFNLPIRDLQLGYFHKSTHNLDYDGTNSYRRFHSKDWLSLRYNFGSTNNSVDTNGR
jgi:hypothetical protein